MLPIIKKWVWILTGAALLVACSGAEAPATSTTVGSSGSVHVEAERWYRDEEKQAVDPDGVERWVAAWFAGEDAMPESIDRWWMVTSVKDDTPEALLARSVALLEEPPEGRGPSFLHDANGCPIRLP